MSIESIEEKVKARAEVKFRSEFEKTISPLRDQIPDCTVFVNGMKYRAIDIFTDLTAAIYNDLLPKRQEQAVMEFITTVEEHKLDEK